MTRKKGAKEPRKEAHRDETKPCQISSPRTAINDLPVEILELIIRQIGTLNDVVGLQAVCKHWKDVLCTSRLCGQGMDLDFLLIDDKKKVLALQGLFLSGLGSGGVSTSLNIAMVSLRCRPVSFSTSNTETCTLAMLHSDLYENLSNKNDTEVHTMAEVGLSELQCFKTANVKSGRLPMCWTELTKVQRQHQRWRRLYFAGSLPGPEDDPVFIVGSAARDFSRYTIIRQMCRKHTLQLNVMMRDVLLFLYYLSSVNNPVRTLQLTSRNGSILPPSQLPPSQLLRQRNKMSLDHILNLELDDVQLNHGRPKEIPHIHFPNLLTLKVIRGTMDSVLLHSMSKNLKVLELPCGHKMNTGVLRAISRLHNLKVLVIDQDLLGFSEILSTCDASGQFPCPSLEDLTLYSRQYFPVDTDLTMTDFLARLVEFYSSRLRMRPLYSKHTEEKVQQTKAAVHLRKLDAPIYANWWGANEWNESFERCLVLFPHLSTPVRYRAKDKETATFFDEKCSAIAEREIKDYFEKI